MKKTRRALLILSVILCVCAFCATLAFAQAQYYTVYVRGESGWESCVVEVESIPAQTLVSGFVCPPVTVTREGEPLDSDFDYSVTYFNNTAPGTATARITFTDDYLGYVDVPFEILPGQFAAPEVLPIPEQTYTGEPIEPELTVVAGKDVLVRDVDYYVSYYNNVNAGQAQAVVSVFDEYGDTDDMFVTFEILPVDAAVLSADDIPPQGYTGFTVYPPVTFSFGERQLYEYEDYDLDYDNCVGPGKGTVTATFHGNFTGTRTLEFEIRFAADLVFEAENESDTVYLSWSVPYGATSYRLYRYDAENSAYVLLKHTKLTNYEDKNLEQLKTYKYKLVPYSNTDGKIIRGAVKTLTVKVGLKRPNLALKTMNKKIKIAWTQNPLADGYLLYRYDASTGKEKKIAKITDNTVRKYLDKNVKNGVGYNYTVCSYKKIDGKNLFSAYSDGVSSLSVKSLLSGVKKQRLSSYPIYNVQGAKTRYLSSVTLREEDLKILEDFANKYFKHSWTDEQKLRFTLDWINSKVYYPLGREFEAICNYTHTVAIFKYKKGQCLQYNGAMCAMMTYLGYPSQLIMGYRGTWGGSYWQHFWAESVLNETTYVLETGNYGRSGDWSYFFQPYSETFGYIKNRKNVS